MFAKGSSNGGRCSSSVATFFLKNTNITLPPYIVIISQKHKNRNPLYQNCGFYLAEKERLELYSRSLKRLWRLALRAMLWRCHNARGATFAASLTSKLAASALLGYLRHRRLCRRRRSRSSLRANKKGTPKGAFFVGGEGETRTLAPGLIRPTPLAGAPRHQLEYFSIHQGEHAVYKTRK